MKETKRARRWGLDQRLEFIEFRLFWDGYIQRADIQEKFLISAPQATNDISEYRESAPENITYDLSAKKYVATETFKPKFYLPNPDRYLAQIKALEDAGLEKEDTFFGFVPDFDVLPLPHRSVTATKLRQIVRAIRAKQSLYVQYQSMSDDRPDPTWRTISPHALASDGMRWHVRAFCHLEETHKDFIISRCIDIGRFGKWHEKADNDEKWATYFEVILVPNPALSNPQKKTIERDYGMKGGECKMQVRLALLYYFDKRLRLDVAEKHDRPKETPVIVKNRKEYEAVLGRVKT